jgi:hypothetical protein
VTEVIGRNAAVSIHKASARTCGRLGFWDHIVAMVRNPGPRTQRPDATPVGDEEDKSNLNPVER